MTRGNILTRLERLEKQKPPVPRYHVVLGSSNEEVDEKLAALQASPAWSPDDHTLVVRFVSPEEVTL